MSVAVAGKAWNPESRCNINKNKEIRKTFLLSLLESNLHDALKYIMAQASDLQRVLIQEILPDYDKDTVNTIWRIVNEESKQPEYIRILNLRSNEAEAEPEWVYFFVSRNQQAEIWAIKWDGIKTARVIETEHLTKYDINKCISVQSVVYGFRVTNQENGKFVAQIERRDHGERIDFDVCLYIGTMRLSLPGIKAIMGWLAWKRRPNCLVYCKDFVEMYYTKTGKTRSTKLDSLTLSGLNIQPEVEVEVAGQSSFCTTENRNHPAIVDVTESNNQTEGRSVSIRAACLVITIIVGGALICLKFNGKETKKIPELCGAKISSCFSYFITSLENFKSKFS